MDSVNYPNFVDDQGGKSLLSKGALPQQTIMRYDVDLLTSNWHDVESKHKGNGLRIIFNYYHNIQDLSYLATLFFFLFTFDLITIPSNSYAELQNQLDAVDKELEKREKSLKAQETSTGINYAGPTTKIKFANNSIVKPGSNICGSGFTWSGTFKTSNSSTFRIPQRAFENEKIRNHTKNIQTEYGIFTKECDLPVGNINVNKSAPLDRRCTLTKDELRKRMPYSDMSVKEYISQNR